MKRKDAPGAAPERGEEGQTFESMMERLEALVSRLEGGNLSLEESIQSFEEGVGLVKRCTAVLSEAERRIRARGRRVPGSQDRAVTSEEPSKGRDDELT
jgi:exodeoxyribonuclease VII small subunit